MRSAAAHVLASPVALYIRLQRDRLHSSATPLPAAAREQLRPYFRDIDLDRARLAVGRPLYLPDACFARLARGCGLQLPATIAAITFDNVIASREPLDTGVLFHELVHVVQYRLLGGIDPFARSYVHGFLASGSYEGIPLERCAYELESRFQLARTPFAVEPEVARRL